MRFPTYELFIVGQSIASFDGDDLQVIVGLKTGPHTSDLEDELLPSANLLTFLNKSQNDVNSTTHSGSSGHDEGESKSNEGAVVVASAFVELFESEKYGNATTELPSEILEPKSTVGIHDCHSVGDSISCKRGTDDDASSSIKPRITTKTSTISSKSSDSSRSAGCHDVCKKTPGCFSDTSGSSTYCKTWQDPQVCYGLYWTDASYSTTCYHSNSLKAQYCPERWPVLCDEAIEKSRPTASNHDSGKDPSVVACDSHSAVDDCIPITQSVGSFSGTFIPETGSNQTAATNSFIDATNDLARTTDDDNPSYSASLVNVIVHEDSPATGFDIISATFSKSVEYTGTPTSNVTSPIATIGSISTFASPLTLIPPMRTLAEPESTINDILVDTNTGSSDQVSVIVHSPEGLNKQNMRRVSTCQSLCDALEICKGTFGSTCMLNNKKHSPACYGLFYTDSKMSHICYAPKDINCPNQYPVPCP